MFSRTCQLMLPAAELSLQNTSWRRCPWPPISGRMLWVRPCRAVPTMLLPLCLWRTVAFTSEQSHHSMKGGIKAKKCLSQALNKTSDLCNAGKALTLGTSSHQASVNQQRVSPKGLRRCSKVTLLYRTLCCWAPLHTTRGWFSVWQRFLDSLDISLAVETQLLNAAFQVKQNLQPTLILTLLMKILLPCHWLFSRNSRKGIFKSFQVCKMLSHSSPLISWCWKMDLFLL